MVAAADVRNQFAIPIADTSYSKLSLRYLLGPLRPMNQTLGYL
jgi:hypothetical protein